MKKTKKFFIIVVGILFMFLFIVALSMYLFQLCPPSGPWVMPPWCEGKSYIPFEYKMLPYVQENFEPTEKTLDFIVGTFDIWGSPHFINLGENSKDHIDTTMKKAAQIGGEGLYFSDFTRISKDLSVETGGRGAATVTQSELKKVVSEARKNNLNKIILITNLYDPEAGIRRYKGKGMEGTLTETLLIDQSIDNWKKLFDSWENYLLEACEKAQNAGVDYLVITPSDFIFSNFENKTYLNERYLKFIDIARKNFNGKIGIYNYQIPTYLDDEVINKIDFIVIAIDSLKGDFDVNNVNEIESAFTQWLSLAEWKKLYGKEVYLCLIFPSYDGALKSGWIEPGAKYGPEYKQDFKEQALAYEGLFRALYSNNFSITGVISYGYWWTDRIYPEVKVLRNDLSHSIRNKDAENIFYKWSRIFK